MIDRSWQHTDSKATVTNMAHSTAREDDSTGDERLAQMRADVERDVAELIDSLPDDIAIIDRQIAQGSDPDELQMLLDSLPDAGDLDELRLMLNDPTKLQHLLDTREAEADAALHPDQDEAEG